MDEAVRTVLAGGVAILPTDTVYGMAAVVHNPDAVRRIFEIKQRGLDKPLPVLVAGMYQAIELGRFSPEAESAARDAWPGPLTLVVPAVQPLRQLGGDGLSVGLRMPESAFVLAVIEQSGPLAATSANLSGEPPAMAPDDLPGELMDSVDLVIDGGVLSSSPSRVVSFVGGRKVLRQ